MCTNLLRRRKSDIENERLPPELFDADSDEGKAIMSSSQPSSPSELIGDSLLSHDKLAESVTAALVHDRSEPNSPMSPMSPGSPFRRGHARNASLGTTMTSPSTRRRSIESTISLIHEAWESKDGSAGGGSETPDSDMKMNGIGR
jgi:serine/threonine-protein phosphatase 2B catalytic subunit